MKKATESIIIILSVSMLCACAANTEKDADIALSSEIALDQKAESDSEIEAITDMEVTNVTEAADQEDEEMFYIDTVQKYPDDHMQ
jgi:hypothetical protein